MTTTQLISPNKSCQVQLSQGEYWVRLSLPLAKEFTGGPLVRYANETMVAVEVAHPLSSSYNRENWLSGLLSGALYAFRSLQISRQVVVVSELSGRLRASDMDAVANCCAIAVYCLADKEVVGATAEGWDIQVEVTERPSPASQVAGEPLSATGLQVSNGPPKTETLRAEQAGGI